MSKTPIRIPKDKAKREALYNFAGLTDEERAAIDQFVFDEAMAHPRAVPDDSPMRAAHAGIGGTDG